MKIIDVKQYNIYVTVAKRHDNHFGRIRMGGLDERLFIEVHADNGIIGYGDYEADSRLLPETDLDLLVGRDVFDFVGNEFNPALGMALYDAMGKHLEVPAYKLMRQKVRDGVSVAAWTRPCPPKVFRDEVERAVQQGYTIFKMHTTELYDIMEQNRLAAEVAPEGFKLHWDFTGRRGRTIGSVLPLIAEMERHHPIVGFIEDPLDASDIDGWREVRSRTQLPIVHGGSPKLEGVQEILHHMADIYMIGGSIGYTLRVGHAYGLAKIQCLLQSTGGTLTKAMVLHMASILPSATAHSVILDDQYDEDVTTETIPVTDGYSQVPEKPGLGFEIDHDALERAKSRKPFELPRIIGITHFPSGRTLYTPRYGMSKITGREEGTIRGIYVEQWEDDGSDEFDRVYNRIMEDGPFEAEGWERRE